MDTRAYSLYDQTTTVVSNCIMTHARVDSRLTVNTTVYVSWWLSMMTPWLNMRTPWHNMRTSW